MADVVTMPKLGFDMAEGVLVRWAVAEGEQISKGQLLAEIETDKATVEVESPYSGVVFKHIVSENTVVPINDPIAVVAAEGEEVDLTMIVGSPKEELGTSDKEEVPQPVEASSIVDAIPDEGDGNLPGGVRASPLARNFAEANGVPLQKIKGSGPMGRIVKRDVERFLTETSAEKPILTPKFAPPSPPLVAAPDDVTIPLTKLRQAIGRRMTESKQYFPHFYVSYEYDMDPIMEMRSQANAVLNETGVKLSVNDFVVKAVAMCLRLYPNLNASLSSNEVIQHGHINIGIAVAVDAGLLTIVCKDADLKAIRQISIEVREMAARAREGKVKSDDVQGSTFTTSNLGMYGVDDFIAIINPPEAAILAIGGANQVPVVKDGELAVGWRMKMTISADHRVTDGAGAAQFMQALATYIENPLRLLL